jgi:hypothetical protein
MNDSSSYCLCDFENTFKLLVVLKYLERKEVLEENRKIFKISGDKKWLN